MHAPQEVLGLLGVETLSEEHRVGLQLIPALIDQAEDGIGIGGDRRHPGQRVPQDGQIVIDAEQLGQPMGVLGVPAHRLRRHLAQPAQVVPEVLDPFTPVVQVLDSWPDAGAPERLASTTVAA